MTDQPCTCTMISSATLAEPAEWEQAPDCPVHPTRHSFYTQAAEGLTMMDGLTMTTGSLHGFPEPAGARLVVQGEGGKTAFTLTGDGVLTMGAGITPTAAAQALIRGLGEMLPPATPIVLAPQSGRDPVEAGARAAAIHDEYDGCFERLDAWDAASVEERELGHVEEPLSDDLEQAAWWRDRIAAALAAALPSLTCIACDELLLPDVEVTAVADRWAHRDCAEAGE
jgi:hypothetical protein